MARTSFFISPHPILGSRTLLLVNALHHTHTALGQGQKNRSVEEGRVNKKEKKDVDNDDEHNEV